MDEPGWVSDLRRRHVPWTISNPAHTICLLDNQPWPCDVTRLIWQAYGQPYSTPAHVTAEANPVAHDAVAGTDGEGGPCMAQRIDDLRTQGDTLEAQLTSVRGAARQYASDAADLREEARAEQDRGSKEVARLKIREAAALEHAVSAIHDAVESVPHTFRIVGTPTEAGTFGTSVPWGELPPGLRLSTQPVAQAPDGVAVVKAAPLWELVARWRDQAEQVKQNGFIAAAEARREYADQLDEALTWEGP